MIDARFTPLYLLRNFCDFIQRKIMFGYQGLRQLACPFLYTHRWSENAANILVSWYPIIVAGIAFN